MDDLFLKIINGEIPAHKVYEDDDIIAFLDVAPVSPGHTLVVPKKWSRNLLDTEDEILEKLFPVVKKVSNAIKKAFSADGISIRINNELVGGQKVFHLHVHVIPRYEGDDLKEWRQGEYKEGEAEEVLEKIKIAL